MHEYEGVRSGCEGQTTRDTVGCVSLGECAHGVHVSRQRETPQGDEASVSVLPGAHAGRHEGNTGVCKCL